MLHFLLVPALSLALLTASKTDAPGPLLASELFGMCNDSTFQQGQAACRFFIMGVVQGMRVSITDQGTVIQSKNFCMPPDVTAEEMRLVLLRFVRWDFEHYPEDRQLYASGIVVAAMLKQYPCKK